MNWSSAKADLWWNFHERFQALADEELKQGAAQRDRFVCAYFTYRKGAEILQVQKDAQWALSLFSNSEKLVDAPNVLTSIPAHGPFCLIQTPEYGLWTLSGGVNENLQERFQTLTARAGIALDCAQGIDPVDFWLHRLVLDLRENRSKLLVADSGEDGMIRRACEASAIFCSRLERKVLETSASTTKLTGELAPEATPWRRGPDPPVIRDLVNFSMPSGRTDVDIVLKIAEILGARVKDMPESLGEARHSRGITIFRSATDVLDQIVAKHEDLYWSISDGTLRFEIGPAKPNEPDNLGGIEMSDRKAFVLRILDKKGWSILDWANESGVDFHTANDYVNGKTNPYRSTRKKLADSLGINVDDLPK